MSFRAALNMAYALLIKGRNEQERAEFDTEIHGWSALNRRGESALRRGIDPEDESGGEG